MVMVGNASAAASVLVSPGSQSGLSSGDTFSVDIDIDSGVDKLSAMGIELVYGPATFEVRSIKAGSFSGSGVLAGPENGDDGDGTVTYDIAFIGDEYTSKAGTLVTVEFRVKDDVDDGTYSLSFSEVRLIDDNYNDLGGTATGSTIIIGTGDDDSTAPGTIDLGSQVKSTSSLSSSSSSSVEQPGYSYIFGSSPDDYKVLNRYGELQTEANWSQDVLLLATQVEEELAGEYLFRYGKVTSIGTNSAGYLVVVFYEPLMAEGSEMDEIYELIDGKAKEMGIKNVPVEFGEGTISAISDDLQELMARAQETESKGIENFTNDQSSLYDPTILATVGKIPSIRNEKECWEWYFQDSYSISLGINEEMNNYLQGGMLLSTGLSPDGYFAVDINKEADMDRESLMDEVYAIINRAALNIGVSEVPVVFRLAAPDEDTLASTSEEETAGMEDVGSQAQETPGFGFVISLLSISMICYVMNRCGKLDNEK